MDIEGPVVDDSDWHHYAYVRHGNTHRIFYDGAVVASGGFSGTAAAAIGEPVVIGDSLWVKAIEILGEVGF